MVFWETNRIRIDDADMPTGYRDIFKLTLKRLIVLSRRLKHYRFGRRQQSPSDCIRMADGPRATFFGYHDKSPFSGNDTLVLGMSVDKHDVRPTTECTPASVGFFTAPGENDVSPGFTRVATTTAWCWQQGCMLQWYPRDSCSQIIFNTQAKDRYISEIWGATDKRKVRSLDYPIYAVSSDGTFAVTLNFSRLGRLRPGYGYASLSDPTQGESAPEHDGLFLVDMATGKRELMVNLATLSKDVVSGEAEHYVNHATFSPSGKRMVFFHLWVDRATGKRHLRACLLDCATGRQYVVEEKRILSHYCWHGEDNIIASTYDKLNGWQLRVYDLYAGQSSLCSNLAGDGHPMMHPHNPRWLLFDTYPDRLSNQTLAVFDLHEMRFSKTWSFYNPMRYRGRVRCDLHPRWSRGGRRICVDSACSGRRSLYVLNLSLNDSTNA